MGSNFAIWQPWLVLISQSRKVETPYVTGDMLKGPFKYFGGVVEPWWVTSLGVGIHVPEGVPLFYRLPKILN